MSTANKGLDQPAYNSNVNTWGTGPLNTNFGYIDLALGGSTLLNATGLGGTTVALSAAQCRPLSLIVSGTPGAGGGVTYTIPAGIGGQWVVRNNTVSAFRVRIQSAAGGPSVLINAGDNVQISCDGTSSGVVRNDTAVTAAGSPAQVQYNLSGALAGSANMVFNGQVLTAHTLDASTGGVVFPDNTTQTTAAAVAGSNTQVQFNDGGAFAGDAGMVFNKTTNALTLTGPLTAVGATLSSTLTMSAAAINGTKGSVASAATTNIGAVAANNVDVTGSATITSFGTIAFGATRTLVFSGTPTLVQSSAIELCNGGANITAAAGDTAIFISSGGGNWKCYAYQRASGRAVNAPAGYTATNSSVTSVAASYSTPMTITEGTQLFSHSYTGASGNTLLIAVDVAACYGQNSTVAVSIFINGATNAVATSVVSFPNVAAAGYPNRVLYSLVSPGTATTITARVAGYPISLGQAVLSISEFKA